MNITSEGEQLVNKSNLDGMKTIKIMDTVTGRVLFSITGLVCAVYEPRAEVSEAQLSLEGLEQRMWVPYGARVFNPRMESVIHPPVIPAEISIPHDGAGYTPDDEL